MNIYCKTIISPSEKHLKKILKSNLIYERVLVFVSIKFVNTSCYLCFKGKVLEKLLIFYFLFFVLDRKKTHFEIKKNSLLLYFIKIFSYKYSINRVFGQWKGSLNLIWWIYIWLIEKGNFLNLSGLDEVIWNHIYPN